MERNEMFLKVGNDNGNSEHGIVIDGTLIKQPNVYTRVDDLPWIDDTTPEEIAVDILNNIVVSIDSPSCEVGTYYCGNFAFRSDKTKVNLLAGIEEKQESPLTVINTLGTIAAYATKKSYSENGFLPTNLNVKIDMATALPVSMFSEEAARYFEKRFMQDGHQVTVHLGKKRVRVYIDFDFVRVVPEATPAIFSLQYNQEGKWNSGDIFNRFQEDYNLVNIDGSYLKDKILLHVDIGDGTTEYVASEGVKFDRNFATGSMNGIGHAIEEASKGFARKVQLRKIERQVFSEYLKNPNSRYHQDAIESLRTPITVQTNEILKEIMSVLEKKRNEVDIIVVYGGGSILMNSILQPKLKALTDQRRMKLLYVPAKYAVDLNSKGLDFFVRTNIFKTLKAEYMKKNGAQPEIHQAPIQQVDSVPSSPVIEKEEITPAPVQESIPQNQAESLVKQVQQQHQKQETIKIDTNENQNNHIPSNEENTTDEGYWAVFKQ